MNLTIPEYILIFIVVVILIGIISFILESGIKKVYLKLQNYCIKNSDKHLNFYEKLILINYRVSRRLLNFFSFIRPFKTYNDKFLYLFNLKLFSFSFRDTIKAIGIYAVLGYVLNLAFRNLDKIQTFIKSLADINLIESIKVLLPKLYENKWYILAILSAISIIYGIYKNKFTNKILEEFQDEELKEIIVLYKKISFDLITFEMLLLHNIKSILASYKKDGVFVFLFNAIENRTDFCEYDCLENCLVVKENNFDYSRFGTNGIDLKDINQPLDNIENAFNDYNKKEHFYGPYAINKYFKGLNNFDIEYLVKSTRFFIDERHINKLMDNIIEDLSIMIDTEDIPRKNIVDILNQRIKEINPLIYSIMINSIERVIQIDKFNRRLRKAMSLKKHRDKFSIDSIISSIK